jgi:hypothetical protein
MEIFASLHINILKPQLQLYLERYYNFITHNVLLFFLKLEKRLLKI